MALNFFLTHPSNGFKVSRRQLVLWRRVFGLLQLLVLVKLEPVTASAVPLLKLAIDDQPEKKIGGDYQFRLFFFVSFHFVRGGFIDS
jgi:hypothetical protein